MLLRLSKIAVGITVKKERDKKKYEVKTKKLRNRKHITILALTAVMLAMITVPAMATPPPGGYTIDGNLSDWGVDPGFDWYSETAKEQVEENYPGSGGNPGDERCDVEAMYIDEDENGPWVYFAIVTSMPEGGFPHPYAPSDPKKRIIPGDLALDLSSPLDGWLNPEDSDGRYGFEYGVKLTSHDYTDVGKGKPVQGHIGSVFKDPVWVKITTYYAQNNAKFSNMVQGSGRSVLMWKATDADIAYVKDDWSDGGHPNYVIEMRIPKSALGISDQGGLLKLLATQSCTNDIIVTSFAYSPIPEFATIAVPALSILGLFLYFNKRKHKKE